jgi:hypothetical protein
MALFYFSSILDFGMDLDCLIDSNEQSCSLGVNSQKETEFVRALGCTFGLQRKLGDD